MEKEIFRSEKPLRILIDQDGVLADFELGFLNSWRSRFPERIFVPLEARRTFYVRDQYPKELWTDVQAVYTEKGFIRNLPPISGAIDALKKLAENGHIIKICTSPLSQYKNCVEEKYEWVENNLGSDWVKNIILAKDKTEIRADLLIDDKPNVEGSLDPIWEHLLFDQPYNRQVLDRRRLMGWGEIPL